MITKHRTLLFILAAVVLIVGGIVIYNERKATADYERTDANWSLIVPALGADDHIIGDLSAPVQVIVYADFQCAYCGRFFTRTLLSLQTQFGDKIVVAYRHLPIVAVEYAQLEAEASECIYQLGGNDAFWRFTHSMFSRPNVAKDLDLSLLPNMAVSAGVDRTAYLQCMEEGRGKERVKGEHMQGSVAGLNLTPSIVLKSEHRALIVKGDYPLQISAAITYLLKAEQEITQQSNP